MDFGMVLDGFWEAKILDFRTCFDDFSKQIWKSVAEGQMIDKKPKKTNFSAFLARPGGMCGARGRDREGVIRRSRPRLLKLSILGLIDIWQRL